MSSSVRTDSVPASPRSPTRSASFPKAPSCHTCSPRTFRTALRGYAAGAQAEPERTEGREASRVRLHAILGTHLVRCPRFSHAIRYHAIVDVLTGRVVRAFLALCETLRVDAIVAFGKRCLDVARGHLLVSDRCVRCCFFLLGVVRRVGACPGVLRAGLLGEPVATAARSRSPGNQHDQPCPDSKRLHSTCSFQHNSLRRSTVRRSPRQAQARVCTSREHRRRFFAASATGTECDATRRLDYAKQIKSPAPSRRVKQNRSSKRPIARPTTTSLKHLPSSCGRSGHFRSFEEGSYAEGEFCESGFCNLFKRVGRRPSSIIAPQVLALSCSLSQRRGHREREGRDGGRVRPLGTIVRPERARIDDTSARA